MKPTDKRDRFFQERRESRFRKAFWEWRREGCTPHLSAYWDEMTPAVAMKLLSHFRDGYIW